MNCNTSVWPSESLHCGKRDPIRPWKRVLMNGERASPFGPMLSYIYIPNSKPYTRIVLPHRERYRCFRFLFSPFFFLFHSRTVFRRVSVIDRIGKLLNSLSRYNSIIQNFQMGVIKGLRWNFRGIVENKRGEE